MLRARSTRLTRIVVSLSAIPIALLLASTAAVAQTSTTATIRGNVADSSGGVLPGATVTITNVGTKAVQTVTTDGSGQYLFDRAQSQ
jgi:type 1 fimbria pilin